MGTNWAEGLEFPFWRHQHPHGVIAYLRWVLYIQVCRVLCIAAVLKIVVERHIKRNLLPYPS